MFRKIPKICVAPLQVRMDSAMRTAATNPYQQGIGVPIDVNITMENAGKWKKTKTHRIWMLQVEVLEADQLTVIFDTINLPEYATICYYSSDRKHLACPPLSTLNRQIAPGRHSVLPPLNRQGSISSIIIEYREPINVDLSSRQFKINKIFFGRFLNKRTSLRGIDDAEGGSCEIDINCSEGVCWHSEGMAIASIGDQSTGNYGTGVLLKTVINDRKLYLYTARHVVIASTNFNISAI